MCILRESAEGFGAAAVAAAATVLRCSEEWAEQFAAAAAEAAALHSEARQTFSSKQQLLAALRVLRAQQREAEAFKEMQQQHVGLLHT